MIGFGELLVISIVALLVIRPEKMPEVLRGFMEARRVVTRLYASLLSEDKPVKDKE
ncbi:MAG TPA: twin-arginine translocase TatA/TatE family subunit [Gammaproteobacteria bacterium]|nr:twin-arginine translocase TatA/TatE family subunit [Gammaproteobacteria bacterium]